jgi:DNA-binding transcriptional ArsR family regulator
MTFQEGSVLRNSTNRLIKKLIVATLNHMVEHQTRAIDQTFQALADPTRRAILNRLAHTECTVSELAQPFTLTLAAVSKHIKVLERANLLEQTRVGREHRCKLNPAPLKYAAAIIAELETFWIARVDALEHYLQEESQSTKPIKPAKRTGKRTSR